MCQGAPAVSLKDISSGEDITLPLGKAGLISSDWGGEGASTGEDDSWVFRGSVFPGSSRSSHMFPFRRSGSHSFPINAFALSVGAR